MTSVECVLEVMEQPAERVKFRTEVKRKFSEEKSHKIKATIRVNIVKIQTRFMVIVASSVSYFWAR